MKTPIDIRHRNIGRVAKALRAVRGYDTITLSKKMGVSQSYLSLLERGRRRWTQELVEKLAVALGQEPNELTRLLGANVAKINITVQLEAP